MEITKEELNALKESLILLRQVEVKGRDNIYSMSGVFSRIEAIIQEVGKRESAKPPEAKKEG